MVKKAFYRAAAVFGTISTLVLIKHFNPELISSNERSRVFKAEKNDYRRGLANEKVGDFERDEDGEIEEMDCYGLKSIRDEKVFAAGDFCNRTFVADPDGPITTEYCKVCDFIEENEDCQDVIEDGIFNYLNLMHCSGLPYWLSWFIIVPFLFVLLNVLGSTADLFLVPCLTMISEALKLSPSIAGITFLALGNGAPDIATSISALSGSAEQAVENLGLQLSGLLGAAVFVTNVVLAVIVWSTVWDPKTFSKYELIRDVGSFIIVLLVLAGFVGIQGRLGVTQGVIFLLMYFVYIIVSLVLQKYTANTEESTVRDSVIVQKHTVKVFKDAKSGNDQTRASEFNLFTNKENIDNSLELKNRGSNEDMDKVLINTTSGGDDEEENGPFEGLVLPEDGFDNIFERIIFFAEWPFMALRYASIFPSDGSWSRGKRIQTALAPFGVTLHFLLTMLEVELAAWKFITVLGFAAIIGIGLFLSADDVNKHPLYCAFPLLSFISSVLWLNTVADEIVSVITQIGITLDLSPSILGVTVLAVSNSLGDMAANVAVAKAGQGAMALAACYGSPLLNHLLGIGLALLVSDYNSEFIEVDIDSPALNIVKATWITLMVSLVLTLIVILGTNFKPPRWYAIVLVSFYLINMLISVLIEVGVVFSNEED